MARRTVAPFAFAAFVAMGAACTLLNLGDLDDYRGPPRSPDVVVDADEPDADGGQPCGRRPPPRPARVEATDRPALYFALDDARWSEDGGASVSGFDLDGVCTCPGEPSCSTPNEANGIRCDDVGGVDNSGNVILESASTFVEAGVASELKRGRDNLILGVTYNGLENDDTALVSLLWTAGTEGIQSDEAGAPTFDGGDRWTLDPGSVTASIPRYRDHNAYLTDRTFVADASNFVLKLGRLESRLWNGIITGRLEQVGGLWRIVDGHITGAVRTRDLLMYLVRSDACPGPDGGGFYELGAGFICGGKPDMRVDPVEPGKGRAPCDALAISLAFSATEIPLFNPATASPYAREPRNCGGRIQDANALDDCDY